jgi:hypothetical protein
LFFTVPFTQIFSLIGAKERQRERERERVGKMRRRKEKRQSAFLLILCSLHERMNERIKPDIKYYDRNYNFKSTSTHIEGYKGECIAYCMFIF